ncbi:hypothetical protein [uncultured Desulfovibrio sp.]|uniref:hypothetical protein n=1 Tax=uncultured Desulfovibrio sp. TaxID=167968 RepID=UPI00263378A5|nr:hypothetical protein [uncultured Desulfovibrio sp.]
MKVFAGLVLAGGLLFSLAVNAALFLDRRALKAELAEARAAKEQLEQARTADAAALGVAKQARQRAERMAKEKDDALRDIEKNLDSIPGPDLCRRLRGLLPQGGACGADAAPGPAGGLPASPGSGGHRD